MARFLIKTFDAEAVVFDTASGDTHYLSPLAYTLLNHMQSGMNSQEIPIALADIMNIDHDIAFDRLAGEAIDSLQRIGLLGRA